jgi:hypothetical protein
MGPLGGQQFKTVEIPHSSLQRGLQEATKVKMEKSWCCTDKRRGGTADTPTNKGCDGMDSSRRTSNEHSKHSNGCGR